jgi:hypothetical protein
MDWNVIWLSGFGVVFLVSSLVLAIKFPRPTAYQQFVFRTVFALSSAGIGATIPGFLSITTDFPGIAIRGGGAIALFVVVYSYNPAKLIESSIQKSYESSSSIPEVSQRPFRIIVNGDENLITLVEGGFSSNEGVSINGDGSRQQISVPERRLIQLIMNGDENRVYAPKSIYRSTRVSDSGDHNRILVK